MRNRFHLVAGFLICLTALAAWAIWRKPPFKKTSPGPADTRSAGQPKPRSPRNFRLDDHVCGATAVATYVTDDGEQISRVSYATKSLPKDFENELHKAGRVLTIERTPNERCQARALIEQSTGCMTILLQYGSRDESSGVVVMIDGPSRDIVEEFEAVQEKPQRAQPVFSKSMAYSPPSTGH